MLLVHAPDPSLLIWDDRRIWRFDPRRGRVVERERLPSPVIGIGRDGLPRFQGAEPGRPLGIALDPLRFERLDGNDVIGPREASDSPETPEAVPFVEAGRRRYRARLSCTARVTRHLLEVCDEGHPPREIEIASYTLRSDRLHLAVHGPDVVRGHVGPEPLAPVASVAGRESGPVLVARRRFDAWHEHVAGQTIDLVGHGPSTLELAVVPEGAGRPATRDAGSLDEVWEGLDRRGPQPPVLVRATGVRAIGLFDDVALLELIDAAAPRGDRSRLAARRRALAAVPAPGC